MPQIKFESSKNKTVYVFTKRDPVRWIAGTLVHELAHVNGAPGGDTDSKAAEGTLPPCGFDDIYNPAIIGERTRRRPSQVGVA